MEQKFVFTTSPWKDHQTGKWMLSCFISIQLDDGSKSKLSSFPDILNWMSKLNDAYFFVQWDSNLPLSIEPKTSSWNAELFGKLFHEDITVRTFKPLDISNLQIKSYPVKHINNFILNTYKDIGNLKIDELPKSKFITKEFIQLNDVSRVQLKIDKPLTTVKKQAVLDDFVKKEHVGKVAAIDALKRDKAIGFSPVANAKMDFGQFFNFHSKLDKKKAEKIRSVSKPEFEFHDVLAILTSYPLIMRKLGLVLDFELPGAPPSSSGTVRILPSNFGFEKESVLSSPATSYIYTGQGFYPASKAGSHISKGMLKINNEDFEVVQIDTDGAAMKLSNFTETIKLNQGKKLVEKSNYVKPVSEYNRRKFPLVAPLNKRIDQNTSQIDEEEDDDDVEEGLPSLRSAGIGILKNGLAQQLLQKFTRNIGLYRSFFQPTVLLNNQALLLTAKQEAKNDAPKNKLTNLPVGKLAIRNPISSQKLQTFVSAFEKRELIPVPTEILYADDIVMGYRMDIAYEDRPDQWFSLHKRKMAYSFAPSGKSSEPIGLLPEEEIDEGCIHLSITEDEEDDGDAKKLNEVIARWEGWSLAVPRVGKGINTEGKEVSNDQDESKKYQLDKDMDFRLQVEIRPAPKSLPKLRFGKKYRIKIRTVDIAGNGLPHHVMPEDTGICIKGGIEYRRFEPLSSPIIHQGDEVADGDRKKMRDRDGESLLHMVIRSNVGVDTITYEDQNVTTILVDGRSQGTLKYLPEAIRYITAPRTSQHMAETHGVFDHAMQDPNKARDIYNFITSRDKENVMDGKTRAAVIPVSIGQLDIDYLADPMAAGVVFTMKSETSFETPWRKGESKKFSFYFDDAVDDNNANRSISFDEWKTPRSVKLRLIEGQGEPYWKDRVFTIPLPKGAIVEINYASFWRPDDLDNYAGLLHTLKQGNNAQRLGVQAKKGLHWMFSPWRTIRMVHAVQQPLEKPILPQALSKVERNFQDSFAKILTVIKVHGSSTDRVDVESEWSQWIDELDQEEPKQVSYKTHVATIPVLYNDNLIELFKTELTQNPKPDWLPPLTQHFNDTKYRRVKYAPKAVTRFREYFTGILDTAKIKGKELPLSQQGDPIELIIPNSARPNLPLVDYVIPSFSWIKSDSSNNMTHLRTGNIRVYLRRPWYSSGDDEMLGVILLPNGIDALRNQAYQKYCTVWGMDPVYSAQPLNGKNFPLTEHFTGASAYDTVNLAEENVNVSIAAYEVAFDKDKQLYFADIPVQTGSAYFPFVKLSLARYQKNSIRKDGKDCCLSGQVFAEWIQVVPSRNTSIKMGSGNASFQINIKGTVPFTEHIQGIDHVRVKIKICVEPATIPKSDDLYIAFEKGQLSDDYFNAEYLLNENDIKGGQMDFSKNIILPDQSKGKLPYRIVIREYELHRTDPLRDWSGIGNLVSGQKPSGSSGFSERLVFMDVFELNVRGMR